MPILWIYFLKNYLKVFFLTLLSFLAVLLVSRLEEIAYFSTLGTPHTYIFLFIFYQIPYVLPLCIPLASLIASTLLFQRLSCNQELTALRGGGMSLGFLIAPLLIVSAFFAVGTFYIASELATKAHLTSRKMAYNLSANNPLVLLQNAKIAKLQGTYIQMQPIKNGKEIANLIIAFHNHPYKRMGLLLVKQLETQETSLKGNDLSFISSIPSAEEQTFDSLILENQKHITTSTQECAHLLYQQGWKIANDHLCFAFLRMKMKMLKSSPSVSNRIALNKCYCEILRRISLSLATLTFTLMGIAYGINIKRTHSKKNIFYLFLFTSLSLISFIIGKEYDHIFWKSALFFLLPHPINIFFSLRVLKNIRRGIV